MELLDQPLDVKSEKLAAPPKRGNRFAIHGRLLVVWTRHDPLPYVSVPESDEERYLAFYHPNYGWCACQLDKTHGALFDVLPVSESAMWVSTKRNELIHILVGDTVKATMLIPARNRTSFLYASANNLWIQGETNKVMQLRLRKDDFIVVSEQFIPFHVQSMYPLVDGAWVLAGKWQICVFRFLSLEKKIYEAKGKFVCHPPFLVRKDENFYYTEDPRRGWRKMPISIENARDEILFFAKHNDIYLAAVYRYQRHRTLLYRFSGESEMDAEYMWEISEYFRPDQFAMYNGLVCIVDMWPLVVHGHKDAPENREFLIWNPQSNTFYEDIPQFSIMHAGSIIPHKLQIPAAWSDRDKGQDMQGA